jgi:hypothetical protein
MQLFVQLGIDDTDVQLKITVQLLKQYGET